MRGQNERVDVMSEQTIFEACVDVAASHMTHNGQGSAEDFKSMSADMMRDVIQTIIDLTPSPRTVDELTYILREADADAA